MARFVSALVLTAYLYALPSHVPLMLGRAGYLGVDKGQRLLHEVDLSLFVRDSELAVLDALFEVFGAPLVIIHDSLLWLRYLLWIYIVK